MRPEIAKPRKFAKNEKGRDFIIGDLHGALDVLKAKMNEIKFDKSVDRMFSVGDLVDRGPNSYECLLLTEEDWFHACVGNHEIMLLDSIQALKDKQDISRDYCAHWFDHLDWDIKMRCEELVRGMMPFYVVQTEHMNVGVCHAECPVDDWQELSSTNSSHFWDMIWNRRRVNSIVPIEVQNIDLTIHGHTILPRPHLNGNSAWIDTGAVYGDGHLTCIELSGLQGAEDIIK